MMLKTSGPQAARPRGHNPDCPSPPTDHLQDTSVEATLGSRRQFAHKQATFQAAGRTTLASNLLRASLAAFVLAAFYFWRFPGVDISAADLFYMPGHRFIGHTPWVVAVRYALKGLFVVGITVAVIGLVWTLTTARQAAGLTADRWLFLSLALSIGPGLVANVLLKDQIGRARPSQIEFFGGTKQFTPPLVAAKQCERNCSFVSGEASSMFALFFALALVLTQHSRALICAAIAMGSFAGLIRMAQGGHFLSDVVFAGVFMCITVAALHLLIVDAQPPRRRKSLALADRRGRQDAGI
jgi:lipid A 4'-phosphatase